MRVAVTTLAVFLILASPARGQGQPDATPTNWHVAAHLEPFMTAPEPPTRPAMCVIDTGVTITPDLEDAVVARYAYDGGTLDDVWPARDGQPAGHGTHVATFAAGRVNGWGSAGAWPWARIVSVRVVPADGGPASAYAYARAITQCRDNGANVRVINVSIVNVEASTGEWNEFSNRVQDARSAGINVVIGAGNGGGAVEPPANLADAVAVGAATNGTELCAFSARGEGLDLLAPGCDLAFAGLSGEPTALAGTSFAAPHVAVTLLALRAHTGMTASDAEAVVLDTARPTGSVPAIDARAAAIAAGLEWAKEPTSSHPASPPIAPAPSAHVPSSTPIAEPHRRVLSRPVIRVRREGRRRVVVRLLNRPYGARVEVWLGRAQRISSSSRVVVRVAPGWRRGRVRFVVEENQSSWARMSEPTQPMLGLRSH